MLAIAGSGAAGAAAPASDSLPTTIVETDADRATRRAFEIIARSDREYRTAEQGGPPILPSQMRQGEPLGSASPPPKDRSVDILAGAAILLGFIAFAIMKGRNAPSLRMLTGALPKIGHWRRQNSALLIVAGIAIVAASITVLKPANLPYELRDYVREGWVSFGGAIICLIGIYDRIRTDRPPEI